MKTHVIQREVGDWEVWVSLDHTADPKTESESFVIATGSKKNDALRGAVSELLLAASVLNGERR